jgi:dsDNA-specific endonuclease/ATPase MutS2
MATDQEVLDSVTQLKTDLEAKAAEANTEFQKLETELAAGNPVALDNLKSIIDGIDTSVKGAVVPTT